MDDRESIPCFSFNISYRSVWRLTHEVGIDYSDIDLAVAQLASCLSFPKTSLFHYAFRFEYGMVVIDCFHRLRSSLTHRSFDEKGHFEAGNRFAQKAS